jgi:hypothetical protein
MGIFHRNKGNSVAPKDRDFRGNSALAARTGRSVGGACVMLDLK